MEINENSRVVRQIEVYENGNVLFYDHTHLGDNYGMLSDKRMQKEDIQEFEITKAEFELMWNTKRPINR
jgi:hypothetical protein